MASIVKRDGKRGPSWQVKTKDALGRQTSATFRTAKAAKAYAAELTVRDGRGGGVAPRGGDFTLRQWTEHCQSVWRLSARSTRARYQSAFDDHVLPALGDVRLDRLDSFLLERFVGELYDVLAVGTVRTTLTPLKKALNQAVSDGLLDANPMRGIKLRPAVARNHVYLAPEQVELLADAVALDLRAYVYLAAYCGLRPGELFALRWSDIDLEHVDLDGTLCPVVTVRRTVAHAGAQYYESDVPKTKRSNRVVPIPVGLVLDELLLHQTRTNGDADGFVFPSPNAGVYRFWTQREFSRKVWQPMLAAAATLAAERGERALPKGLTPHKLRHTAVALWIRGGAEPLEVSTRAGHSSVAYTYDNYGGLFPDRSRVVDGALAAMALAARQARASLAVAPGFQPS